MKACEKFLVDQRLTWQRNSGAAEAGKVPVHCQASEDPAHRHGSYYFVFIILRTDEEFPLSDDRSRESSHQ